MKISIIKGFTLIELLIVISIIAVLSSIVLASMPSVRDNARLAAGKTFSTHNYSAFGADAFAYYNFDEVSGSIVKDLSGNGFDLNSSSGNVTLNANIPNKSGKSFDASTIFLKSNQISKNIGPDLTLSGWVFFNNLNGSNVDFSVAEVENSPFGGTLYGLRLFIIDSSVVRLTAPYNDSGNFTYGISYDTSMTFGKWYHVAVTFKNGASNNTVLYIDGKQVKTGDAQDNTTQRNATYISLANEPNTNIYRAGNVLLDDVAVYNSTLLASDIQKLYAQGLPTHSLARNK